VSRPKKTFVGLWNMKFSIGFMTPGKRTKLS
jgi:hypothetical protein